MRFAEDDDAVQTLSADTAVQSLGVWILPGAAISGENFLDPHVLYSPFKPISIYPVPVTQQIPRCRVPRKSFDYLLRGPFRGWMGRYIEMNHATSVYREEHQYVKHGESDRWRNKEVD